MIIKEYPRSLVVDRDHLATITKPEATDTYRPIGHDEMVDLLAEIADEASLKFTNERYELSRTQPRATDDNPEPEPLIGKRFFGKWELESENGNGHKMMLGMRNSYDGSMSYGICAGTIVTVCSNMLFSGDFVALRKHTVGLGDRELRQLTMTAIIKIIRKAEHLSNWHRALQTMEISPDEAMSLIIEGFERKVYAASKLRQILEAYQEERRLTDGQTSLYTILGAFTRMYKDFDLFSISKHTAAAEQMLDEKVILRQRRVVVESTVQ